MNPSLVHGILCVSCDSLIYDGIKTTLDRIRKKAPKDYNRLIGLVLAFVSCEMGEGIVLGRWINVRRREEYMNTEGLDLEGAPGLVLLEKSISPEVIICVVAHELGHAATLIDDLERRGPVSEEWQHEMAAEWYMYKWGFGRESARQRKNMNVAHHGAGPGQTFHEFIDGTVYRYKVSRNFVAVLVGTTEGYLTQKWNRIRNLVRTDLGSNQSIDVNLVPLGLENASLVGDCSIGLGFWMLDQARGSEDQQFYAWRVTAFCECFKHSCLTQFPLRKPGVDQPGSEILGASVSVRLIDSEFPAIGEYLVVLHRNVLAGNQQGSGSNSVVLTWINAKTSQVSQEEICLSDAWFSEDGVLVSACAEILEMVEGNGIRIRLKAQVPLTVGIDGIQVFYPPEKQGFKPY